VAATVLKNRHISATVRPIVVKCGVVTHFVPLDHSEPFKIRNFKNPRWRRPSSLEIEKSPYLNNGLTGHRKIWHDDAYWHTVTYLPYQQLKIPPSKNPRWHTATIFTIKKSRYVDKGLTDGDDLPVTHLNPD